ncbi:MAG: CDP-diacylglycerol--glycerol-3-phosphate 3-phosphatidyltransferase [Arcobacter sp.]|nr:MAG: CDP-diacylglycerol--glycerol-3-phosphate 3-phosphatidyltransferase [Arcobacter sp.]
MLNIPNALAFIRVLLAPVMFWIILKPEFFTDQGIHITWVYYLAALIFVLASITDFFDGYVARMLDQATLLGKILDPLADKMLTIGAFLALMMTGDASPWAVYIIIVRELFITGLRTVAVAEGIDVGASFAGKVKTVTQMIAIGFLIMHWDLLEYLPFAVDNALLWFATLLTLYSGAEYIMGFSKAFKDK